MCSRLWTLGGVLGAVLLVTGAPAIAEQETVFEMEEISVFDQGESAQLRLAGFAPRVQSIPCSFVRPVEVKRYPELKSDRPMYGSIVLGQDPADPGPGVRFHYVIDESQTETEATEGESLLNSLASALADTPDPKGADRKYDRLYFDANGDMDLTNDPVVEPMEDPPFGSSSRYGYVFFDYLSVSLRQDPDREMPPIKILPYLRLSGSARAYMAFIPASARKGKIRLEGQQYVALLLQSALTGRFDSPSTSLALLPTDLSRKLYRAASTRGTLSTLHWAKGKYYQFSATPAGDKLTAAPYRGDCGLLKVDSGGRENIEKLGISGSLRSEEMSLPVGDIASIPPAEKLPEHRIPVGDYTPVSLSVDFGKLTVSFFQNRYSKDEPHVRMSKPPAGTVKIRKDKPVVMDFSNKPVILFTAPARGQTFKPGSSIRIRAVIVDPKLDLLVCGLDDTTQKVGERTYTLSGGEKVTIPRFASLAPTVTITDASGKQVAQGTMPFG